MSSEMWFMLGMTFLFFLLNIYRKREIIKTQLIMVKTWIDLKAKEKW